MDERTFLVALDAADPRVDSMAIRERIRSEPKFTAWWNHIPYVFLITTPLTEAQVSKRLKPLTQGARFLVVEINPEHSEGWLPERAWRWIRRRSNDPAETNVAAE